MGDYAKIDAHLIMTCQDLRRVETFCIVIAVIVEIDTDFIPYELPILSYLTFFSDSFRLTMAGQSMWDQVILNSGEFYS